MQNFFILLFIFFIISCGGGSSTNKTPVNTLPVEPFVVTPKVSENLAIPNNTLTNHFQLLLIGNSHVASNNLPALIKTLIEVGKPSASVYAEHANGFGYLDEKLNDGITLETIQSKEWSHVILQAQKYSQSGSTSYPTIAAEYWIDIVKQQQGTPILFPEHPQENNLGEAQYIHDIHLSILEKQNSCIAPIGLGWDKVAENLPDLKMHQSDENHAAYVGSFFTALIFYQVITNELADALPYIPELDISELLQAQLGEIASQILDEHQSCHY